MRNESITAKKIAIIKQPRILCQNSTVNEIFRHFRCIGTSSCFFTISTKTFVTSKFLFVSMDDKEKVGKLSETDSIGSKVSSKTSHGKKDSKKKIKPVQKQVHS